MDAIKDCSENGREDCRTAGGTQECCNGQYCCNPEYFHQLKKLPCENHVGCRDLGLGNFCCPPKGNTTEDSTCCDEDPVSRQSSVVSSPSTSQATPTAQESVLVLTGGSALKWGAGSKVEVYPKTQGCSLPPLPSPRYGHKTFVTSGPMPLVATCGGVITTSGGTTNSCLVLDAVNQRWDDSRMGNLRKDRWYGAVAELPGLGVYFMGYKDSDFLAAGTLQWQQGPDLPMGMSCSCAVPITPTSFITIKEDKIHEFDAALAGPTSNTGWRDSSWWPTLKTSRFSYPGCAKIGNKVIVAGGADAHHGSGRAKSLHNVEVLDLASRSVSNGGSLVSPRALFNLGTISSGGKVRLFAFAGKVESNPVNTVEEWVEETYSWRMAESLTTEREMFGAATVPKELACPK